MDSLAFYDFTCYDVFVYYDLMSRECFLRFRRIAVSFRLAKHVLCRFVPLAAINGEISPPEFLLFTDGLSLWEFRSGNSHIFSAFLFYSACPFPCVFHDYFKLSLNNCCLCHCLYLLVPPVSSPEFFHVTDPVVA